MSYIKKAYRGINFWRTSRDIHALEKRFVLAFQRKCEEGKGMSNDALSDFVRGMLNPPDQDPNHPAPVTDRDREVVATVIQWLGTEIGQHYLADAMRGKKPSTGKAVFGRRGRR